MVRLVCTISIVLEGNHEDRGTWCGGMHGVWFVPHLHRVTFDQVRGFWTCSLGFVPVGLVPVLDLLFRQASTSTMTC